MASRADLITDADKQRAAAATPKLRSRKDGAAVPLDDVDRRLLNLMQGSFPIAPRPYRHVAEAAEVPEAEVMSAGRSACCDKRIIRQVTPIFDTRALGYSSMLVAAKVDPEQPHRAAAKVINAHPGRLAQLPAQPRVQHVVHDRHRAGLRRSASTGRSRCWPASAGAESIRQLPTLKLFKIRMDLEMEGGTEALASRRRGERADRARAQPYDELDIAVIRAIQGDMPVISEPYAAAAAELGIAQQQLLDHLAGMQERGLLRRVAAILYHRRAGFSANGMGVWKVPDEQIHEIGCRMASVRGISHCYQRPTYEDWPYSVFTMAHGRSKEECDAVLDAIAAETGIQERATLYSSTEFKKIRLLYFTEEFKDWEREHAGAASATGHGRARERGRLPTGARRSSTAAPWGVLPGGVNSPVRAMRAIGRDPIFVDRGEGAELIDVDGNRFVDYVCSWGPLIHGHAHPEVLDGDRRGRLARARASGRRRPARSSCGGGRAPLRGRRDAAHDLLGNRGHDDRRPPGARRHRPRADRSSSPAPTTGMSTGCSPGRLRARDAGAPLQPGRARGGRRRHDVIPWNDPDAPARAIFAGRAARGHRRAPARPTWASSPQDGLLELLRERRRARRAADPRRGHQWLQGRPRRRPGTDRRQRRLDGAWARSSAAGCRPPRSAGRRELMRLARPAGLPGRHPVGQPAGGGRRAGNARAARRDSLPAPRRPPPSVSPKACARPPATSSSHVRRPGPFDRLSSPLGRVASFEDASRLRSGGLRRLVPRASSSRRLRVRRRSSRHGSPRWPTGRSRSNGPSPPPRRPSPPCPSRAPPVSATALNSCACCCARAAG